jgi:hypothetical protein
MSNFTDKNYINQYNTVSFVKDGSTYYCPGFAKVSIGISRDVSTSKINGVDGELVEDAGGKASKVSINILMSGSEYQFFISNVYPIFGLKQNGSKKPPIGIKNAIVNNLGYSDFVLESIDCPTPESGQVSIMLSFVEYDPNVKKQKKSNSKTSFKNYAMESTPLIGLMDEWKPGSFGTN